ncbi:aspartate/glutamate racemase family protein [Mariniflexile sp. HMF6888]|uniref:aspartate/glutamate racemase family protein n=1 Tax=Mariniflexile sp. HMF6888 TaxID=3373086 RepID=UPI00379413FC
MTDKNDDAIRLFGDYMRITGTPTLQNEPGDILELKGKKLGVVNGSNWVSLWSTWFGKKILPGVKIINTGNEAVQLNFMTAYHNGEPCPPQINIDLFCNYAKDLYDLYKVDAILISCSTMNRAYSQVQDFMRPYGIPVIQIDEEMMEEAVETEGKILVVATHGPTVNSTQELLQETAEKLGKKVDFAGVTVEEAFDLLGEGNIEKHNEVIAEAIRNAQKKEKIDIVVLAQLSMSVFSFSYPNPEKEFGVKVLNSGETGFRKAGKILSGESV